MQKGTQRIKDKSKGFINSITNYLKGLSRRKKIFLLLLLIAIVAWRINSARKSGLEVDTASVQRSTLTNTILAPGTVTADEYADLSFQTSGEVAEVNVKEGDSVEKGDIIAKLDTTSLYSSYLQSQANLRRYEASLDKTYDDLQGHETDESFEQIETRTLAETNKDKAYWALVAASKNLAGAYIKAPFDGIVTQVPDNLLPGSYASAPSTAIFSVVNPETIYFEAEVNELEINDLFSGAKTNIQLDAFPGETYDQEVFSTNFSSVTTSTGGTAYQVRISLPENDLLKFKLGMNGDAEIVISEKHEVLLIPANAVVDDSDKSYVWIVENGRARKRIIEVGESSINDVEILSGLEENQSVIVRPPSEIEEGVKVKIN
jgi:RND family efflux transporter MFP subunit